MEFQISQCLKKRNVIRIVKGYQISFLIGIVSIFIKSHSFVLYRPRSLVHETLCNTPALSILEICHWPATLIFRELGPSACKQRIGKNKLDWGCLIAWRANVSYLQPYREYASMCFAMFYMNCMDVKQWKEAKLVQIDLKYRGVSRIEFKKWFFLKMCNIFT